MVDMENAEIQYNITLLPSVNTIARGMFCGAKYTHLTFTPVLKHLSRMPRTNSRIMKMVIVATPHGRRWTVDSDNSTMTYVFQRWTTCVLWSMQWTVPWALQKACCAEESLSAGMIRTWCTAVTISPFPAKESVLQGLMPSGTVSFVLQVMIPLGAIYKHDKVLIPSGTVSFVVCTAGFDSFRNCLVCTAGSDSFRNCLVCTAGSDSFRNCLQT